MPGRQKNGIGETLPKRIAAIISSAILILLGGLNMAHAIETFTAHGGPIKGLTLDRDEEYLVTASFDYSAVLWRIEDMQEVASLVAHDAAVNTARFSPDGKWLATGGDDYQILLWNMAEVIAAPDTVEPIRLNGHLGKIVGMRFSRDSRYLASASWDGTIGIWPIDDLASKRFITGHDGPVNDVQFSDDGRYLYSAGYDGHVRYWQLSNDEYLRSVVKNGWGVNTMEVHEARGLIAYGTTDGAMMVVTIERGDEKLKLGEDRTPVLSLHWNIETDQIAFGNAKGRVMIVDTGTWTLLRDFRAAHGPVWGLVLMPDDGSLIVAGLDDYIARWRISDYPQQFLAAQSESRRFHLEQGLTNGEMQFARKCSVCHTLEADGRRRAGPTLYGIFGRKAGSLEGYPYSDALLYSRIVWNEETIDALFREGPDIVTPGTKMPVQRMKREQDRLDLINFLKEATAIPATSMNQ